MAISKQTKMLLGVGAAALVGYLIYKQSQPKDKTKNAAGSRTMNTMLADEGGGGAQTTGGASTLYAQACDGKAEGAVCAYVSPRSGDMIFAHCKKTSGGGLSCEK
jgi:hypothetical protein